MLEPLPPNSCTDLTTVVTRSGRLFEWHEPGWGDHRPQIEQSFAALEVVAIGTSSDAATAVGLDQFAIARKLLTSIAFMPGCDALEIRYVIDPSSPSPVRLFMTAKSTLSGENGRQVARTAVAAIAGELPPIFATAPAEPPCQSDSTPYAAMLELRRDEAVTFPQWDYIPTEFYYHIEESVGDGTGWYGYGRLLSSIDKPLVVSLLFQQTEVHELERDVLGSITTDLAVLGTPRTDINLIGQEDRYPACENARIALDSWQRRMRLIARPLLARVTIGGDALSALSVASSLAGAIAESTSNERATNPMWVDAAESAEQIERARHSLTWLDVVPWGGIGLWRYDSAPHVLRRFPYIYGVGEAAALAVLPVPDRHGVPGFAKTRRLQGRRAAVQPEVDGPTIHLGAYMHQGQPRGEARLPLSALNRHALVVGTPGAGKTTTTLTMLAALWREHAIPFLVIEPAKSEYRSLLGAEGFEALRVVCLGRDDVAPLRINPLLPPAGVRREVQTNSLMAALKASLPLPHPLPELLEHAIERAYERHGWRPETTSSAGLRPPSLRTVADCFEEVFAEAEYVGEAKNVASAMRVRLRSLLRGSRGRILDTVESVDFSQLLRRPVIVELDEVSDNDDKAVLAMLILEQVRASARSRGSSEGALQHVTVVEEAHRLLGRGREGGSVSSEEIGSRAAGVEAFVNAIAELRSYGEGFVLCSQNPSSLAAPAVNNCSTRILHRLENSVDRNAVIDDAGGDDDDRDVAARLRSGEAIVKWPPMDDLDLVTVAPGLGIDSSRRVTDEEVVQHMESASTAVRGLLPYPLCTRDVCTSGCSAEIRYRGHLMADNIGAEARATWNRRSASVEALDELAELLVREASGDVQLAYCGGAHLAAYGSALNVRRNVDIRRRVASKLKEVASE
jgi:hypothetical protein